jgi:hypothetical protein
LRANPSPEQIAQFARDLACEDLRPQVQRLAESFGAETAVAPQSASLSPLSKTVATSSDSACKRDEARLAKLRIESSAEQVTQFSRELTCEDLRPQVQRLMESLGADPTAVAQSASLAPASQSKGIAKTEIAEPQRRDAQAPGSVGPSAAESVQACRRDAAELARIRANPDRASLLRLSRNLKCENLRAQVARLLEGVGD